MRLASIVLLWCVALASAAAQVDAARIDELLRLSGLWEEAVAARDQIKAGAGEAWKQQASPGRPGFGAAERARFDAAIDKAFAPDAMRGAIAAEMRKLLSGEDADAVLAWLSSDLGKRLTRLEEEGSRVEESARAREEADKIVAALAPARLRLLERLLDALGADERNFEVARNMAMAMVYAMTAMQPQGDPEGAAEAVRARLEAQRGAMMQQNHEVALASTARAYRDVSDEDLDRYVEFNRTPAAKRFNDATLKGFQRALVQGSLELGRHLGRETRSKPTIS